MNDYNKHSNNAHNTEENSSLKPHKKVIKFTAMKYTTQYTTNILQNI